jgi:myo-inositol catabolism protein IolS
MEKRSLGTTDVKITPILMGTWQAGKRAWVGIEDADSIKTLRAAYEAGITTIDTAEAYGEGHSERIIVFQGENFERAQQALEKLRPISSCS